MVSLVEMLFRRLLAPKGARFSDCFFRYSMKRSVSVGCGGVAGSRNTYDLVSNINESRDGSKINIKQPRRESMAGQTMKVRAQPAIHKLHKSPEFESIFTNELQTLIALFKKYNYELRIAGGAVRDILMKITPKDVDLATTATPTQMIEMFSRESVRMINTKGERHGTITPRINDKENFEVTTLRIDVRTDGRHAEVEFTTDWQLDANRRDLTINSMFLDFDGVLYDYFYGYEDLLARHVVFVGDAAARIQEDYLRILRYFRFYGRIAQNSRCHDQATINAIKENVAGLASISGERIWVEMKKIVIGNFGRDLVEEMIINCQMAEYLGFPNSPNLTEFNRVHLALGRFTGPHHAILFAIALLHTADDAVRLHERLKLSAYERDLALFITHHRGKVNIELCTLSDYQVLCIQSLVRRDFVEDLLKYMGETELYEQFKSWSCPSFPLNGNVLKAHGCPQGKQMGKILTHLKLIWAQHNFNISNDELLAVHLPAVLKRLAEKNSTSLPRSQSPKTKNQLKMGKNGKG